MNYSTQRNNEMASMQGMAQQAQDYGYRAGANGSAQPVPQPMSALDCAIEALVKLDLEINEATSNLAQRLSPVLRPFGGATASGLNKLAEVPSQAPAIDALERLQTSRRGHLAALQDFLERLAV